MSAGGDACDACLRRAELLGRLASRIAGALGARGRRVPALLELTDEQLVAALGGAGAAELERWLERFQPMRARERVAAAGLECVCRHAPAYPRPLLDLPDPPGALYVAGPLHRFAELAGDVMVTVVGGRRATPYALEVACDLGRGLAAADVTVVSGLALGVDAAAHRGALEAGDRALAVLAGGVDIPYPRSHEGLYRALRSRAALVSELPPGTLPLRWSFPARNRIMAALGRITVVVEAQERSGSLITAGFASDIGRDVGAVPGKVTLSKAAGSNRLLRDGARLIRGAGDVLDELFGVGAIEAERRDLGSAWAHRRVEAQLEAPLRRVLEAVEAGHGVAVIGSETGLRPGEVRAALGRLELQGLVARDGLGHYERTAGG